MRNTEKVPFCNKDCECFDTDCINYIEADGRYSILYTICGKKKIICKYLKDIVEDNKTFVRCNRSYAVNIAYIDNFDIDMKQLIVSDTGTGIDIGEKYKISVLKHLHERIVT